MSGSQISSGRYNELEPLPTEVLEIVLSFLDAPALVELHIATGTQATRQRLRAMRCGRHWLGLVKRLPPGFTLQTLNLNAHISESPLAASEFSSDIVSDASEPATYSSLSSSAGQDTPANPNELYDPFSATSPESVPTDWDEPSRPLDADMEEPSTPTYSELSSLSEGSSVVASVSTAQGSQLSEHQLEAQMGLDDQLSAEQLAAQQQSLQEQRAIDDAEFEFELQNWHRYSKHNVLKTVHHQIQHINDIATLMYRWSASARLNWEDELIELELDPRRNHQNYNSESMHRLSAEIMCAFSLGHASPYKNKYVDNAWKEFVSGDPAVHYLLEFNDEWAFICTLYQLQQLPSQAVLARFHGILTRCSTCDLLLLSECLRTYRDHHRRVPATDIISAFAQNESRVKAAVASLTEAQRCTIMLCVERMCCSAADTDSNSGHDSDTLPDNVTPGNNTPGQHDDYICDPFE